MKRIMIKYIFMLLLPLQIFAQDVQLGKFVDSLVGPMNKPDVPGTIVLIARDGNILLKKAYGLASVELKTPLSTEHSFAIGSVSKQFTAVAVLQLAQQGKLKLTDDIRKYFPAFNSHGNIVTIDNLLSHTAGIDVSPEIYGSMHKDNNNAIYPERFIDYATKTKPMFAPGTEWSYSNFSYVILASLVEKISGERFEDYMQNHVFIPAGMSHTLIAQNLLPFNNLVSSYARGYQGTWRNLNNLNDWGWARGAGTVFSTADDMLQWDIALREHKILPQELLEKAWTPYILKNGERINYGYAWDVNLNKGIRIISHSGGINGFATQSVHVPEKNIYVFFVDFYSSDPGSIPRKIVARLLDIPRWVPTSKAEAPLSDYAGAYQLHHQGSRLMSKITDKPVYMRFTTSGDSLFVQQQLAEKTFVRPAGKDRFLPARSEESIFIFNRDAKGNVVSMNQIPFVFGGSNAERPNKKIQITDKPPIAVVALDSAVLKKYAGTYYKPDTDEYLFVIAQGNKLFGSIWNTSRFELLGVSNNKFVRKGIEDYTVTFKNDSSGFPVLTVSGLRDREFKKVRD
jgi:CubicO group peptidase (beta-lactamase class C family)